MDNTSERLRKLEQENILCKERIRLLEEAMVSLTSTIRQEAVRVLGMTFASMGENMLTAAASKMRYQIQQVSDEQPANEQTFYAQREGAAWIYCVMKGDTIVPVKLDSLVEPMRNAVLKFIMDLPAETTTVAFNVYQAA